MPGHPSASIEPNEPSLAHCDCGQRIAVWSDLLDACDQLLLAGLKRKVGAEGDLAAAYRAWHAVQREEHDQMMRHLVEEFNRRGIGHGS